MDEVDSKTQDKMLEVEEKMRPKLYGTLGGEFAMISQMNSIAQHHFTEIFLGNGTDGGAFSATTARLKLKKEQLCSAFSGGVVPDVVFLECDEEQGKKQGRAKDEDKKKKKGREKGESEDNKEADDESTEGEEDEEDDDESEEEEENGKEEGERFDPKKKCKLRFFRFERQEAGYVEVFLKKSTDIGDDEVRCLVLAYARSADEHLNTSLYEQLFNALGCRTRSGASPKKGGEKRRASLDEPSAQPEKKRKRRKKNEKPQKGTFGNYELKSRILDEISNLIPWSAVRVFDKRMEVTMPERRYVKLGVLDRCVSNLKLKLATKLPDDPANELYDPMVKGRKLRQLLCLKPGMKITIGEGLTKEQGLIRDFSNGIIEVESDRMGDISEADLVGRYYKEKVLVEVGDGDDGGLRRRIISLQNVAVKRDLRATARVINDRAQHGGVARAVASRKKGRAAIAANAPVGIMDEDRESKELVLLDEHEFPGEDLCYRLINRLPNYKSVKPYMEEMELKCNVCNGTIDVLARGGETKAKIGERRLKNCITEDRLQSEGAFKDCQAKIERSIKSHSRQCHIEEIPHHFASPKLPVSVWAWEMSVRYVAQVLLEQSLLQVGLDKLLFKQLVETGRDSSVCGQICAILGGAVSKTTSDFQKKLIGCKYNGLYLPGSLCKSSIPSVDELKKIKGRALHKVINKARKWIKGKLLPEMRAFDYTTLVAALIANDESEPMMKTRRASGLKKNAARQPGKNGGKAIDKVLCPGYIWNATGLFFRRGVYDSAFYPPATKCMTESEKNLDYTMWDALEEEFRALNSDVTAIDDKEPEEGEEDDDED